VIGSDKSSIGLLRYYVIESIEEVGWVSLEVERSRR
jgi:hypothetical protein